MEEDRFPLNLVNGVIRTTATKEEGRKWKEGGGGGQAKKKCVWMISRKDAVSADHDYATVWHQRRR